MKRYKIQGTHEVSFPDEGKIDFLVDENIIELIRDFENKINEAIDYIKECLEEDKKSYGDYNINEYTAERLLQILKEGK